MTDLLEIDGTTHIGRRAENQDHFWYAPREPYLSDEDVGLRNLLIVADGVGGENFGGEASQIVVDTIKSVVNAGYKEGLSLDEVQDLLESAMKQANFEVYDVARRRGVASRMGSTVVAAILSGRDVVYSWVGDSRIYYINSKTRTAQMLTKDHTIAEERRQLQHSSSTINEALNHILINSMGKSEFVVPEFARVRFQASGDALVLCSDGLSNMLSANEIAAIVLDNAQIASAVKNLVDTALDRGGTDNTTAVVAISHLDPPEEHTEPATSDSEIFSLLSVLLLLIIALLLVLAVLIRLRQQLPLEIELAELAVTEEMTGTAQRVLDAAATNIAVMTEGSVTFTPSPT